MLWDPSFESWVHFGIRGQPSGVLLSADGELLGQWSGFIPEEDVLAAISAL